MAVLRLIRLCYWLKNLFIFLPALAIGRSDLIFGDPENSLILTFISFSLVVASGYIFNDLADFDSDRAHLQKRKYKPLANGAIDKQTATFWLAAFGIGGLYIAYNFLNSHIFLWELAYWVLAAIYTLALKKIPFVGLAIISAGAAFRVIAGAIAVDTPVVMWQVVMAVGLNWVINFLLSKRFKVR